MILLMLLLLPGAFGPWDLPDPIAKWSRFERAVRDQMIGTEDARILFPSVYRNLKEFCRQYPFVRNASWRFPVQGRGIQDVGIGGFRPDIRYGSSPIRGYDFYDGNRHGGHPGYDIFIRDRNQDSLDDQTHLPVPIVAPSDLLILSAETEWAPGSDIRGGRYIWALDPVRDQIIYFAHLNDVRVQAGVFCRAGDVIGTVGRTGKNASPVRSPTHLHLMVLQVRGNSIVPFDCLPYLKGKASD